MNNSSAQCHKKIREDYKKRLAKGIKIFLKNKKRKSGNMVTNSIKTFLNLKTKVD